MNDRNVVLIGMMGSGKTTVAKILAQKLGRDCLELDQLLVERAGMKIPEIVERYGWGSFRDKESKIAREVAEQQNKIISTGGGVILRPENMAALKKNGFVVYLKCSVPMLAQRIGVDPNRPLLAGEEKQEDKLARLLSQRRELYVRYADLVIDGDNQNVDEKVVQILKAIE